MKRRYGESEQTGGRARNTSSPESQRANSQDDANDRAMRDRSASEEVESNS